MVTYDTSAVGAHCKNLPHQIWIQYRSHARNIGIRIKLFKSVCTLIIMIEITEFFEELFSGQNAGMHYDVFVCDIVNAMDICAAQQSTWHPGKRGCLSAHPLYIHFPCRSFNIYAFSRWPPSVARFTFENMNGLFAFAWWVETQNHW